MFGTKIRSWMEAHIARSRAKKRDRAGKSTLQPTVGQLQESAVVRTFDSKFFGARNTGADFNEILPGLPISSSSFKTHNDPRHRHAPGQPQPHPHPHPQQQQQYKKPGTGGTGPANNVANNGQVVVVGSAVNLSSPESAYSTGYSTDGTSPCATYAPEYYINVRTTQQQLQQLQQQQQQQQQQQPTVAQLDTTTQTRARGRRVVGEVGERIETGRNGPRAKELQTVRDDRIENCTGTYSVSATRSRFLENKEYEHHPWRKPAPPTTSSSRPVQASSPKLQAGQLARKPYSTPVVTGSGQTPSSYPLQLFSPRRMPLVATTTTQVMPIKSPRQRSRVRTNPWPSAGGGGVRNGSGMMISGGVGRPWSRQQTYNNAATLDYHCCRQESLSVGRSPVNRSDWRSTAQLRQQQRQQQLRAKPARSSSASSCSSRSRSRSCSRSCSVSSSSSSNSAGIASNPSSPSSDDITLNEVMGKFDDNYLYEKETDIVSDHSGGGGGGGVCSNGYGGGGDNSSSANFSSDASASSLDLHLDGGNSSSRSTSRHQLQQQRGLSGRRQRRRRHRRSVELRDDEADREHREEVELLQEVLNRRFRKNSSDQASAQTNRALLERLLMKNASLGLGGIGISGFEGRRAWSANPGPGAMRPAASRSVGGTPICLRRRPARAGHVPNSRLVFEKSHQVYPAESTSSLKNISASELALIEADKEADLKYAQLIMEAERMLLNAQQQLQQESASNSRRGSAASVAADNSPSRFPRRLYQQQQTQQNCTGSAPNKRVELIKNAELNIELALSKSRNSQPELSSGSIKDLLDHSSPKRLLQQQQKKIIDPIVTQVVASTQTTENNYTTFQSIDVNPVSMLKSSSPSDELCSTSEHLYSCPQSEPVKRKVYSEGQDVSGASGVGSSGRPLQRQPAAPWLRNSDGDCASDQQQQLMHQPQLQSASAASSYSQLRKHMLIETLQGLKQSLEDQSAALKMSCLRPL